MCVCTYGGLLTIDYTVLQLSHYWAHITSIWALFAQRMHYTRPTMIWTWP